MDEKDKKAKGVFELVEGMTPVDPAGLAAFVHAMSVDVIPEIVRITEKRNVLAAETRNMKISC